MYRRRTFVNAFSHFYVVFRSKWQHFCDCSSRSLLSITCSVVHVSGFRLFTQCNLHFQFLFVCNGLTLYQGLSFVYIFFCFHTATPFNIYYGFADVTLESNLSVSAVGGWVCRVFVHLPSRAYYYNASK